MHEIPLITTIALTLSAALLFGLVQAGAAIIRYDEAESAAALAEALLQDIDVPAEQIDAIVSMIRNELAPARRGLTNES